MASRWPAWPACPRGSSAGPGRSELEGGQGVHPQPAQTPEEDQFSLAELGSRAVLDRLEQTDVNALSPIQALNLLDELKRMLEG